MASRCVEMLGGVGFVADFPVEKFYRDSKIGMLLFCLIIKNLIIILFQVKFMRGRLLSS